MRILTTEKEILNEMADESKFVNVIYEGESGMPMVFSLREQTEETLKSLFELIGTERAIFLSSTITY